MQLARQIVEFAIKAGSSDIHLEEGVADRDSRELRHQDSGQYFE